jgi:phosphatidylglycerol---prolipoprotein diacylglyceryl transferase
LLLAIPFPSIDPVLVALGPFQLRWYALAYIVGIFLGWWYAKRLVANPRLWGPAGSPMKPADIDDFIVWCALGIVVGGRVGYVLFYDLERFLANPLEIFAIWNGGMSFHGGFLGTILVMVIFSRVRGLPTWSLIDVIAPSVTFGLFLGRLANFGNGELYGRVTEVPWGVVFCNDQVIETLGSCPAGDLPRHASQLYEAFLEGIVLFLFLRVLTHHYHKLRTPGFVSGAFAAGYGVARTLVEFFREPDLHIGYFEGWITMGMILSVPMIVAGVGMMIWSSRRKPAVGVTLR